MVLLEICANSIASALHAQAACANRIELCENLEQGGTTPSYGLIKICRSKLQIPIHVLIRPRIGDFVYSDFEFEIMLSDIQACRHLGCAGVVIGILNDQRAVDIPRCRRLVQAAHPMQVTFHRAFDDCIDQFEALDSVISAGCTRILTSGGELSAEKGSTKIQALVQKANGRLIIMPGAGVNVQNASKIIQSTGAIEIHASAKRTIPIDPSKLSMFGAHRFQTDATIVRELVLSLNPHLLVDSSSVRSLELA